MSKVNQLAGDIQGDFNKETVKCASYIGPNPDQQFSNHIDGDFQVASPSDIKIIDKNNIMDVVVEEEANSAQSTEKKKQFYNSAIEV